MTKETKIGFGLDAVGHVLQDKALAVPIYQRSYSWAPDEIDDFQNDLATAFAQSDSEYFLGTIVLSAEGTASRLTIVDGQQRLATTTMLLAAIRDEYRQRGDAKRADIVQGGFLAKADLVSGGWRPIPGVNRPRA